MEAHSASPKLKRLTREDWLELALDTIALEGETKLRIDRLVRALGVTKGSFYWHFRDRADFVQSLAEYWARSTTERIAQHITTLDTSAEERLRALAHIVIREEVSRYDVAMRAWAAHEPEIAPIIEHVDQVRVRVVRGLLAEMGFRGDDLDTRTRVFVVYLSFEPGLLVRESQRKKMAAIDRRIDFFIRR